MLSQTHRFVIVGLLRVMGSHLLFKHTSAQIGKEKAGLHAAITRSRLRIRKKKHKKSSESQVSLHIIQCSSTDFNRESFPV